MRKFVLSLMVCAAATFGSAGAQAATVWDEAAQGDLSGDGLIPTLLAVGGGANVVLGTVGNAGLGVDRDYFTFIVPANATLTAIRLLSDTFVSGSTSFIALQAGSQVTVTPAGGGVEQLLGFAHYGNDQVGTNILPAIMPSLTGGLPAGTYSVWVQETGGTVGYGLDFVISVPEPETYGLLLAGLGLLIPAVRRARRRAVEACVSDGCI